MVAEIKSTLATIIIFTTVMVSLLTWKYQFTWLRLRHFISATKIHYWQIYLSFTGHLVCIVHILSTCP